MLKKLPYSDGLNNSLNLDATQRPDMARISTAVCMIMALMVGGCATTGSVTPVEKRQAILDMKNEVLSKLYKLKPDVKTQISRAPGYAVFSNANVNVVLASFGGGQGVVRNNLSGKHTYMKMGEVGVGLGLGAKDFRLVLSSTLMTVWIVLSKAVGLLARKPMPRPRPRTRVRLSVERLRLIT